MVTFLAEIKSSQKSNQMNPSRTFERLGFTGYRVMMWHDVFMCLATEFLVRLLQLGFGNRRSIKHLGCSFHVWQTQGRLHRPLVCMRFYTRTCKRSKSMKHTPMFSSFLHTWSSLVQTPGSSYWVQRVFNPNFNPGYWLGIEDMSLHVTRIPPG